MRDITCTIDLAGTGRDFSKAKKNLRKYDPTARYDGDSKTWTAILRDDEIDALRRYNATVTEDA